MTLTIYGSKIDPYNDRQIVKLCNGGSYYIRIEESKSGADRALADATPKEGETVLNTVEFEPTK